MHRSPLVWQREAALWALSALAAQAPAEPQTALRVRRETTIKHKATLRWLDSWGDLFAALPLTSRLATRGRPLGVVYACCASSG